MSSAEPTVQDILGPKGRLARSLEGFEPRPTQLRMALLLEESLMQGLPAIVEAGTGTGKTFGYLVPVILTGKKAVISTGTKNLQEQIFFKDLPLLKKAAGLRVDAVMMKGRRNYLCLHKFHQYFSQQSLLPKPAEGIRGRMEKWLKKTRFADRSELPWLADDDVLWDAMSASSEQCLGADCGFLEDCFLSKLRARAARSRIIIVNHHLFFADMKVKKGGFGEIIPRFQAAIFDEAHALEETATFYLGESMSTNQINELAADFQAYMKGRGKKKNKGMRARLESLRASSETLAALFRDRVEKGRVDLDTLTAVREGPAREIRRELKQIVKTSDLARKDEPEAQTLLVRAGEIMVLLDEIFRDRGENWLNWYQRRKKSVQFHASPLDISDALKDHLYEKVPTVQLTSATLSTNGNFDYVRGRLGLSEETLEAVYPSEFDFESQTLMYIPEDLPLPSAPDFALHAARRIFDILRRTRGRALVLFTSYHNLNLVHGFLAGNTPYAVYRQGDAPRSSLLEDFKRDVHSVLLATGSFWQGVDVPGEALSCVIVDKLPFDSPGEPLVAARIDAIRAGGGNPFMEYQVPSAIIALKQGLGRLIRNRSDRGILSVLDKRIRTSRYGRFFIDSLPPMPITADAGDIDAFFKREYRISNKE
ncbi:MAG: ATP-dependent DNA helicase [Deltaproteobacteria bacterium]|nr:ATP-dependent DNA helicase [Deltaproteobacteria bacterium]